ncbi:MAG: zinc ribbon domain-containing protein [Sedimentisphaerales bacterium]|nr:zinc ribbon domain-containing protein [Sedimentisphaerales bacterium]
MPIFEYQCQKCGHVTEFLESRDSPKKHPCARCGSEYTEKLFSGFAVGRSGCSDSRPCTGCTNFECPHS